MGSRVIREAMLEAHQNAERFPEETWYVLNDDFMSVVKESYFIHDDGTRKEKPFVALYNATDKKYGMHEVDYVDGEIVITSPEDAEYFDQPYGERYQEPIRPIGHVGHGKTVATELEIASLMVKGHDAHIIDAKTTSPKGIISALNDGLMDSFKKTFVIENLHDLDWDYPSDKVKPKHFDMATGKMIETPITVSMSDEKRRQLRKKRKKRKK